jgi:DNA-binding HxlR family transcriptional regulator
LVRSGCSALSMLAVPLNVHILEALDEDPMPLPELRRSVGHPPVTTMRAYLRKLADLGIVERHRAGEFPGNVSYTIGRPGRKLCAVADVLRQWLETAPDGPIEVGSTASKSTIKALVDGWDTGLVRALAARPLALTELNRLIPHLSYPALERRLTAMRQVGLVEPDPERSGRVARCQVTQWLRHSVAPLTAAAGWERQCIPEQTSAPGRMDIEAAFLLAVPLLSLSPEVNGTCRLAVELRRGADYEFAGVTVAVVAGKICSCVTRIEEEPDAWATGSMLEWFRWLRGEDDRRIEVGGDPGLVRILKEGLGRALITAAES